VDCDKKMDPDNMIFLPALIESFNLQQKKWSKEIL